MLLYELEKAVYQPGKRIPFGGAFKTDAGAGCGPFGKEKGVQYTVEFLKYRKPCFGFPLGYQ